MALKLFEFAEQFMMDTFFVKINPNWENDQYVKLLFRWEIWWLISIFEIKNWSRFSWTLHFCCSIVELAFLLTMKMHWT